MSETRLRSTAAVLAVILISTGQSGWLHVSAQVSSQGLIPAGGGPIVDCTGASVTRLEAGMGTQREALRRAEEMYRQAQATHRAAADPARELQILQARAQSFIENQATLIKQVRALKTLGLSAARRRELLTLTDRLQRAVEKVNAAQKAGSAGVEFGTAISENVDLLEGFGTFLGDSGLGEEAAGLLANAVFGPAGGLAVQGIGLAQDYVLGAAGEVIAERDLIRMRDNLDDLRRVVSNNEVRIRDLRDMMMENCKPQKSQVQESPKPIPPQNPPAAAPAAEPPPPAPEPKAKASTFGKRLGLSLGIAAAVGGISMIAVQKALAATETADSGSGSGSITFVRVVNPFVCQGNSCTGSIEVNVGVRVTSGYVTFASTSSFLGQVQVAPNSTPGRVTVRMDKSPYLTCYQTQTTLVLWDSPTQFGPVLANLPVSIPVTCR